MNILMVDDEPAALRNLGNVLNNVIPIAKLFRAEDWQSAIKICREFTIEIIFLDIEMPGRNGLDLVKEFREINPRVNIIIVTAYSKYALEALRLFVSGYVLKPAMEEEVSEVLEHLRMPIAELQKGLYVRCFGNFEVFYDGKPIKFGRSKAKEFLAYLIDRRGSSVTNAELCEILFGEAYEKSFESQRHYLHKIYSECRDVLKKYGCDGILRHTYNAYSVDAEKIPCDYYMSGKKTEDYMMQYGFWI